MNASEATSPSHHRSFDGGLNVMPLLFSKAFSSPAVPQVIHPETYTEKGVIENSSLSFLLHQNPHFPTHKKKGPKSLNFVILETIWTSQKGKKGWPGEDCRFFCVFLLFLSGELLGELWTQIPVRMAPGALQSCSTATVPLVAEMFLASYFCSALGFLQGIRQGCTTKIPT